MISSGSCGRGGRGRGRGNDNGDDTASTLHVPRVLLTKADSLAYLFPRARQSLRMTDKVQVEAWTAQLHRIYSEDFKTHHRPKTTDVVPRLSAYREDNILNHQHVSCNEIE